MRLKLTNPEDDPAGFQALRFAYERALAYAGPATGGARRAPRVVEQTFEELLKLEVKPEDQGRAEVAGETGPRERTRGWRPVDDEDARRDAEAGSDDAETSARRWRPPERSPPPPDPPPRRPHLWRPVDPPPEAEKLEVFDEAARRDYAQRTDTLSRLAADPAATPDALRAAFADFLASPMLEDVARHEGAERWVAALITRNTPRTDRLITPAIDHFGWDSARVGPRSDAGARVLARREDLRFLEAARVIGNAHHGALEALIRKPAGWRLAANRLTPALGRRVRGFLAVIRTERPGLVASLDSDAVAWWDRYLSQPRLGPIAIWSLTALPAGLALMPVLSDAVAKNPDNNPFALGELTLGAALTVVLVNLFAIQWPRKLWQERWAGRAPAWASYAWAPALAADVILAALIPPSLIATMALAGIGALALLWAVAVGEPDRRQMGYAPPGFRWRGPIISFPFAFGIYLTYWGLLRPGVRFGWQARSLFAFTYLAVFWLLVGDDLAADAWGQMTAPLLAAVIAFVVGARSLAAGWMELQQTGRRIAFAGLAALVALAVAALWLARDQPAFRPAAVALVAAAVLAHKAPAWQLLTPAATLRDILMRYGWFTLLIVSVNWAFVWARGSGYIVILGLIAVTIAMSVVLPRLAVLAPKGLRARAQAAAAAIQRYGWIVTVPALVVAGGPAGATVLYTGGLWLLTGVVATLIPLAPTLWPAPKESH